MSDIAELLERCRKATGPDRELDCAIETWLYRNGGSPYGHCDQVPPLTASIDAITALIVKELPGAKKSLIELVTGWSASVLIVDEMDRTAVAEDFLAEAPTAPLALTCAFLSAKLAQVTE